jgi:hypothetical protein
LKLGALGAVWPGLRSAYAIGPSANFRIGQVALGEHWNPRPTALKTLAFELDKQTSISVDSKPAIIDLAKTRLGLTPYLYMSGDREFALPAPRALGRLRRFLSFGGFLHIDSAEGSLGGAFDESVRKLIAALYAAPLPGLTIIPREHVVFRSFYLVGRPVGRLSISPVMEGVIRDKRIVVAYTQNDLGGAWQRDTFGNHAYPCSPGGERQRTMAFRMGINLAMYALCLDYKTDQVHVDYIMRRRRWRPNDGAETFNSK